MVEMESVVTAQIEGACLSATRDELSATIEKIAKLMKMSNHAFIETTCMSNHQKQKPRTLK